ncbi:MAG TPA: YajQ family cyclic di-GMP-binding protein [Anaerolineae bacterium]|jgi:cyclic-di-GMP-binding protein|nr:YajQ family cyclic di-GMP-binding protein [Anaerolineae bacterium]
MAGSVSFDVVSEFDRQELVNALDQVRREVATRFDFKGSKVQVQLSDKDVTVTTDSEMRSAAVQDLIGSKAVRRGLSLKIFDWGEVVPAGGMTYKQVAGLRQGLPEDIAKQITRLLRDEFPKVKGQIQGGAVRVSGKSKDELQAVIARLKEESEGYPVALQFKNYR